MIVYPALLFCRLKILCVFLLPVLQKKPSRHGSGSAQGAAGNRLGRTPDPHRCNTDGLRPPTNRMAACSVQMGFAGGWRGSWRPESPWLGVSARLTS
ncbi:hypothetical protein K3233_005281 [Escherichia coli]|nr:MULTISPECIES: hypothetical protein [Enterobacteriaceae]EHY1237154.1 hypothetical protein [Escherichia coli]MBB0406153.1 hypothetical protein [Escherichia coli]MCV1721410.1 hypothetical protein [Escherichia coli]MCZ9542705.1 hypothetical protein [Escherichia coli]HAN8034551.1 hypothetical protein [Escherichia coli]